MSSLHRVSLALLLLAAAAPACKVPVFRFALERWPADNFRLVVAGQNPLPPELRTELDALQQRLGTDPRPINLELDVLNLSELSEAQRLSVPGLERMTDDPAMLLLPPRSWQTNEPVWIGAASTEKLRQLLDSPVRQECVKHLLAGESAVWLVIESADENANLAARSVLETGLRKAEKTLVLPKGVIRREDLNRGLENIDLDDLLRSDLPLKISFATATLSRNDPAEALFLATLLGPAAPPSSEPLIVPVFGRGRTPGPVPASQLNADSLLAACNYLCSSCSCQAKEGNPGYDLLFSADWEEHLALTSVALDSELVSNATDTVTVGARIGLRRRDRQSEIRSSSSAGLSSVFSSPESVPC